MTAKVSVVVPTLNAAGEIGALLDILDGQSLSPEEVVVIDSESDDDTPDIARAHGAIVIGILRSEFNHGSTRHMALLHTTGEYVCFLTQDALPASSDYLKLLVSPMIDPGVALVSGRQLPKRSARRFVQLVQEFNYPNVANVRSADDAERLGIKAFFASDACSCYRRSAYLACGGFPAVETNEDMLMAARLISAGWKVAYEPSAAVIHSHNLSLAEQCRRNRSVGRFLESNKRDLMGASEIGEGGRLVKSIASQLFREKRFGELVAFGLDCAARLAGNRIGRYEARKEMSP